MGSSERFVALILLMPAILIIYGLLLAWAARRSKADSDAQLRAGVPSHLLAAPVGILLAAIVYGVAPDRFAAWTGFLIGYMPTQLLAFALLLSNESKKRRADRER